jgi:glycosyltransferase involved in cell wall biosynthesis
LRILFIHTYYTLRGGEDTVFEEEAMLLKQDHNVMTLTFHNRRGLSGALQFLFSIWNLRAAKVVKKALLEFNPDIVHIHNLHFATGPLIIRTIKKLGFPIIVTLHNYRLLCPSGTLIHKGSIILDSLTSSFPWLAVRKKVYRNSFFLSLWLATITQFHRVIGTWSKVDRFITLNSFAQQLFQTSRLNICPQKFLVKPNFVSAKKIVTGARNTNFLYVGRLSEEKGIMYLIEAFQQSGYKLNVVGAGPLEENIRAASEEFPNIRYLGSLNAVQVQGEMRRCTALVFPSIWYEPFGLVIIEAFSLATPVIASNIGAASELIVNHRNGLHFEPGNVVSLESKINLWANLSEQQREEYGGNALSSFKKSYTPEKNKRFLLEIYSSAMVN